jgi:DNA-binding response OmpR family regulator
MESGYSVFVVDDDKTTRLLLETMLGSKYEVESFDSGERCLARLATKLPNLFLMDVGLPGMDGYELCRKVKLTLGGKNIPVVFISGHDDLDAVLAGYDAGGEDYVVKPFEVLGLSGKIEYLRRIEQDKKLLAEQARSSDELATVVLENLDEYAVLIKFLRTLNECGTGDEVVEAVLGTLGAFHLEGAVQIRMRSLEKTRSKAGENWPLEIAVINHVRSLGRIFEFRTRCAYNFNHITVLVTNMPVDDADLCGRIRDNLAIAAESADAKLMALQSFEDNATMRGEIFNLLEGVGQTVQAYGRQYDDARYKGSVFTSLFLDELLAAFAHLGMSSQQEDAIIELARSRSNGLVDLYDIAGETQATLGELSKKLGSILAATGSAHSP